MGWRSTIATLGPLLATLLAASPAYAGGKAECLDAVAKAQTLRDDSKLIDARLQLLICSATSCPGPVRADCTLWLAEVEKALPTFIARANDGKGTDLADTSLRVDGNITTTQLDGRPLPIDPGSHVLRFERPGYKPAEQTVVIKAGEKDRMVTAALERSVVGPPPPPPPPPYGSSDRPIPIASWIGWGVGAVGLVGFGLLGLKANLDYSSFKDSCGTNCTNSDRDSLQSTMTIADISLVIGLVGAGVGTVFYLMRPQASQSSNLARGDR